MGKVLIIGAGGVGTVVAHKCAQNPEVFNEIVIASRTKSKCDAIAKAIGKPNVSTDQVDADSVPAFIFHTSNDAVVNVKNSLCLASAYSDAGIQFELHIYPDAPHGIALANHITDCNQTHWNDPAMAEWVRMAAYWAENQKDERG